jgi:hypothetical protein
MFKISENIFKTLKIHLALTKWENIKNDKILKHSNRYIIALNAFHNKNMR